MLRKHIVTIVDRDNVRWVFEGRIGGIPIYVKEEEANPKMMSWEEAKIEYDKHNDPEEKIVISEQKC